MSFASYEIGKLEQQVRELEECVTVLKAERDEANNTRDEMERLLFNMLARIHRDGGHYTDEHGVIASVMRADQLLVIMQAVTDMQNAAASHN